MNKETLKTNYKKACNGYLAAFCKKHGYDYIDAKYNWVGGDVGGIACIADYLVDMRTIIDDIQLDAPEEEFLKHYDYCLELGLLGVTELPNFRSWIAGCPRRSDAEIEELKRLHNNVEEAKKILEDCINKNDF